MSSRANLASCRGMRVRSRNPNSDAGHHVPTKSDSRPYQIVPARPAKSVDLVHLIS